MPIPSTKIFLASSVLSAGAYRLLPETPTDFAPSALGVSGSVWVSGIADLNGDGTADIIIGSAGSDDKAVDAGRVYVTFGYAMGGTTASLGDTTSQITIDGLNAGDHAGAAVGSIADLNGDGRAEILVGAPLQDVSGKVDAGAGFVLWGDPIAGGIDLGDPTSGAGSGVGYIIRGEAAGDRVGSTMLSIADLNADGRAEVLIGAPGNDAGGPDAGAAYVVFGKATDVPVDLTSVTAGVGGFRITGAAAGDAAGQALGTLADQNADGLTEILVGAAGSDAGGLDSGAVYVVHGKATGTAVNLATIATGVGGYRITGQLGEGAGAAVSGIGDVNGDGRADLLIGTASGGRAYVVFGQAGTAEVLLSDVRNGAGGYMIVPEATGDLVGMSITGGQDFNRDGVADLVIGTPGNGEGGANAGAVYVVWGGGHTKVDLAMVAQGIGGAKIVGSAGSRTGSGVALAGDLNLDGAQDLIIGSPGAAGESVTILFAPALWQPDPNIYGSSDADVMGLGYGGLHLISDLADSIYGLGGADSITAAGGSDWVDGGEGNDTIDGGTGDDTLLGAGGNDSLIGDAGSDSLDGGLGADAMAGGAGNDTYVVDSLADVVTEGLAAGTDTVQSSIACTLGANLEALLLTGTAHTGTGNALDNTITAGSGANALNGMGGNDTLVGAVGNDTLDGGTGDDSMAGGAGNDIYLVDSLGDVVTEALNAGTDTVRATLNWTLGANLETLELSGAGVVGSGNGLANRLVANSLSSTLQGLGGNDTLVGGAGDDSLDGGLGNDNMAGGTGNDIYDVDSLTDLVTEAVGAGLDTVEASVAHTLAANVETLILTGTARQGTGNTLDNTLIGNNLGDTLAGGAGTDTLTGGLGADSLDGGTGNDSMTGGAGDDTYVVDSTLDQVVELAGGGTDTVIASMDYVLAAEIENLTLTVAGRTGTGNAAANTLTAAAGGDTLLGDAGNDTLLGNAGADRLDGGTGADNMAGAAGNDAYVVDNTGDIVTELLAGGTDTVCSSVDFTLGDNIEALILTTPGHTGFGNAQDNTLTGTAGADTLMGGGGNDTLDGAGGGDSMVGGDGNDTYQIRSAGDVVVETAGGGFDTVIVSSDWTLAENIEAVQLIGTGHALTGNAGSNQLSGNAGSDTLDGGEGDDTLLAGDGDDVLVARSGHDTMDGGSGNDRYVVHGGQAHIEDFLGDDTIDASDAVGDCVIDLSGGIASSVEGQILDFGMGGSTSAPLDVQFLQDLTGSFADDIVTVRGLVPQIVTALQAVQPDALFGVSTFRDKPIGSFGGVGDWVYLQQVGLSLDTAALTNAYSAMVANNGMDGPEAQIEALMQLALHTTDVGYRANSARFVILFTDAPFHSAGDGAAAGIGTPNNGDAIMDGTPPGTGEDYPMIAQVRLALEAANIIPIFAVAGGNDAAYQGLVALLGRGAEVTLTSNSSNVVAAITSGLTVATTTRIENALGGAGHDVLIGGVGINHLLGAAGDDSLDGGSGADQLEGGLGNDTYAVDDAGDVATELAGQGTDTIRSSVDLTLAAEVEDLALLGAARIGHGNALSNHITGNDLGDTLSGDAGNDSLVGGVGTDLLDGGSGADRMVGGAGDDTYVLDVAGDVVVELLGEGTDAVRASINHVLGANVENLVLEGAARSGTGNAAANHITANDLGDALSGAAGNDSLTGGAGADGLNGGLGADTMEGGAGNDTYTVDDVGDVIIELAGGGTDTVRASISYTLGADLENLMLTGVAGLNGTGNALANALTGNAGGNLLIGLDGNDALNGGLGADTMEGGAGNDTYTLDDAGDVIIELAGGGTDTVRAGISFTLDATLENLMLTGAAGLNGTGNALANALTGNVGANLLIGLDGNDALSGGLGADTMDGGAGNDTYTVDDAGDVIIELAGGGTDTVKASISFTLGADLENLMLTGVAGLKGTGNALANSLTGNAGANLLIGLDGNDALNGGLGADTMDGGAGNDTYTLDDVGDVIIELAGGGTDTVRAGTSFTLGADLEKLILTGVADLSGTGNALANGLAGNAGANLLIGLDGNDALSGGAGNDTLLGGMGSDSLTGGLGADAFRFDAASEGGDRITDFTTGTDTLEFSMLGLGGGLTVGMDLGAADAFVMGPAATQAHGQFLYTAATGALFWDVDGTGGASAQLMAILTSHPALVASDLHVFG